MQLRALTELSDADLAATVASLGGKPFQARQVSHWLWKHGVGSFDQMHNVPVHLRSLLAAGHVVRSTSVLEADLAEDGTEKLLLRLHDGESVECVIIPEGERTTLCISTQVGCPVRCVFCASVHARMYANFSKKRDVVQRFLDDALEADLPPVERAVVDLSAKVTTDPESLTAADLAPLRELGFDDLTILDVINYAAFFANANRLMLTLGEPRRPGARSAASGPAHP